MRRYIPHILGGTLGLIVATYLAAFTIPYLLDTSPCGMFDPCTTVEVLWKRIRPLILVVFPYVLFAAVGWIYLPRALKQFSNSFRNAAQSPRHERQLVDRVNRGKQAGIVLAFVAVLIVLQAAFLSVVIDAVDPDYIQSDRYHITAEYLISISELLFAAAFAIQAGILLGLRPLFQSSLTIYLAGFIIWFVFAWSFIDDLREAGVDYLLADRSTDDRRLAALVAINQMALVHDGLAFEEADLGFDDLATPDAKITLFLSPVIFYLAGADSLNQTSSEKIDTLLSTVDQDGIVQRIQETADQETAIHCDFFEQLYAKYTDGVSGAVERIAGASGGIGSDRTYEAASRFYFETVNQELGRGWAVLPGLTREQFTNHRDVQKAIKDRIRENLPEMRARAAQSEFPAAGARAVSSFEEAIRNSNVYVDPCAMNEHIVRSVSSDITGQLRRDVDRALDPQNSTLRIGGEHERYGRTALEIAVLPTVSISALLIGMIFNGRGVIRQISGRSLGLPRIMVTGLILLFVGFALMWPLTRPHDQLDQGAVADLMGGVQEEQGWLIRYSIEWLMRGASGLYDVGLSIREGLGFGMMGLDGHIAENLETNELGSGLGAEGFASR